MRSASETDASCAAACIEPGCLELATVRVRTRDRTAAALCPLHWNEQRRIPGAVLQVDAVLPRPPCFKASCPADAVSAMSHLDGRCLPVCEIHLEDLSWVTPEPEDLAALGGQDV